MDWTQILISVFGLIGTAFGGWSIWSKQREKLDLIHSLWDELAEKNRHIRKQNAEILQLTQEKFDAEMRFISTQCKKVVCPFRYPPLPWRSDIKDTDEDGLPDEDPQPEMREAEETEEVVTITKITTNGDG